MCMNSFILATTCVLGTVIPIFRQGIWNTVAVNGSQHLNSKNLVLNWVLNQYYCYCLKTHMYVGNMYISSMLNEWEFPGENLILMKDNSSEFLLCLYAVVLKLVYTHLLKSFPFKNTRILNEKNLQKGRGTWKLGR